MKKAASKGCFLTLLICKYYFLAGVLCVELPERTEC